MREARSAHRLAAPKDKRTVPRLCGSSLRSRGPPFCFYRPSRWEPHFLQKVQSSWNAKALSTSCSLAAWITCLITVSVLISCSPQELGFSYSSCGTQMGLVVKNSPANAGDVRDTGLIPGSGKILWRRAWQPTPAFLPGESRGQRSLVGYSPWDHNESDTTEQLTLYILLQPIYYVGAR